MAKRNPRTLKIRWRNEGNPKYIDPIPYEWFRDRVVNENRTYYFTRLHDEGRIRARCRINVSKSTATLYYGPDNSEQVYKGTTRVTFHDKRRRRVRRVEWKGEHDDEYEKIQKEDFWLECDEEAGWNWRFVVPVVVVVMLIVAVIVWW